MSSNHQTICSSQCGNQNQAFIHLKHVHDCTMISSIDSHYFIVVLNIITIPNYFPYNIIDNIYNFLIFNSKKKSKYVISVD